MEQSIQQINPMPKVNGGGKQGQRIIGLDIVRSCAIFFVIAGHFFSLNTQFVRTDYVGISMFIQSLFPYLFYTGVPLFLMLTGYLNSKKTVCKDYYKSCIRVLAAYLFFSILTLIFKTQYLGQDLSWREWIGQILRFNAIPYGWYIEMWIGLFLLTPFLNMLYKAIPTKRQKQILILTLYALTALPDLFNRYGFHLVPGFWAQCFPLTFFFIGTYINEYKPQFNKLRLIACILSVCLVNPVFNLIYEAISGPRPMIQIAGGPWGVFGTVIAVAFFLLVYQIDFSNTTARKNVTKISLLSLDMYLCCYIFDALAYPYFKEHFWIDQSQFGPFFFIIVPIVFVCSFATAWAKDIIFRLAQYLYRLCRN